jgi:uncharacterized membrane protein
MHYLQQHWLALALPTLGLALLFLRRWLLFALACILVGVGGLAIPGGGWGLGIFLAGSGLLVFLLFVVVISGKWSAGLGYFAAAVLLLGLGAWGLQTTTAFLNQAGRALLSIGFDDKQVWWLLGLLLIPVMVWVSHGRLVGLGPVRRWLALGIRCLLIVFICLALAEAHARQTAQDVTVLFLIDRSLSIPAEFENEKDLRQERIFNFINQAVAKRGPNREGDQTGVIVFGRFPRLELPPAKVRQLPIKTIHSVVDNNYTDIAAALKLALASFPEGTSKRIVLISDGNENLGNAVEQAHIAKHNGVRIDAVAIASARRSFNEVIVERIEAPPLSARNSKIPLKVVLRSLYPGIVAGELSLYRDSLEKHKTEDGKDAFTFGEPKSILKEPVKLKLPQGLTVRFFQQPGLKGDEAVTYEAKFVPTHMETPDGQIILGLPGDRIENNKASTTVISRGQKAILLVESVASDSPDKDVRTGDHKLLAERLGQGGGLNVATLRTDQLPREPDRLAMLLSKFDCVILANVPADELSEVQQSVIRSNTHEQGAGLIMIGGPQSFGAGGWQDTELEKALPVTCDNKSTKIDVPGGLVLIMHASEMLDGNGWQKKVAKLAIEKLSPIDMLGVTQFGLGHTWHIPFDVVGGRREKLLRLVDNMFPGDMPDLEPSLVMARAELNKPEYNLGTKHVIFISDGDTTFPNDAFLRQMGLEGITLTTVCITSHGAGEVARMKEIVQRVVTPTGKMGRAYYVKDPRDLPQIYVKETRMVSHSYIYQKKFEPRLVRKIAPVANMKDLPPLHGFVRTTRRPTRLVEVPIETPRIGDDEFPVLAYWNYGLGRTVAFTSDARSNEAAQFWDREWAGSKNSTMYTQFWQQVVNWARRQDDIDKDSFLSVSTDQRNGRIRVIIEALDPDNVPITTVKFQSGVTALSLQQKEARKIDLNFEQKAAGIYEAEFQADEVGSFLLNIKGTWPEGGKDDKGKKSDAVATVRANVTIPYSPEFGEMESRPELLHKLADMTGGKVYEEDALEQAAKSGDLFQPVSSNPPTPRPLWWLLVFLTGVGMFFDVAVRRITIEPAVVRLKLQNLWAGLRGRKTVEGPADPFIERLKSRKAKVDDALAKEKGTRRFDGPPPTEPPPPPYGDSGPAPPPKTPPKPPPAPSVAPEKEKEAGDFASRLMRAKKRAQEDRDKK